MAKFFKVCTTLRHGGKKILLGTLCIEEAFEYAREQNREVDRVVARGSAAAGLFHCWVEELCWCRGGVAHTWKHDASDWEGLTLSDRSLSMAKQRHIDELNELVKNSTYKFNHHPADEIEEEQCREGYGKIG